MTTRAVCLCVVLSLRGCAIPAAVETIAAPACLPELPPTPRSPGLWTPFHLLPRNGPVLPIRADLGAIGRAEVIPGEDLCARPMASRRIAIVDPEYARAINDEIAGTHLPLLNNLLGLAAGGVPGGEALWMAFEVAQGLTDFDADFRARPGDEIHRVDLAANDNGRPVYTIYYLLVDPTRPQLQMLLGTQTVDLVFPPPREETDGE